jgi:maltose O-acetyltransferase
VIAGAVSPLGAGGASTRPLRTEREKMIAGEPYFASDPVLKSARARARMLTRRYNITSDEEAVRREHLLRMLFARLGRGVTIEPPFFCDYGGNISLGDDVYVNTGCVILDCGLVRIGSNVLLGPHVQIYAAHHPVDPAQRRDGRELASPVVIEDDVWIGGGAILCPGVRIGRNTTIGAGSVVTRDVPGNVVAAGNPCRAVRSLS